MQSIQRAVRRPRLLGPTAPGATSLFDVDFYLAKGSSEVLVSPSKERSTSTAKSSVLKEPSKPLRMV